MSDPAGVVLARDDGVIEVRGAVVVHGLVETIERLYEALGIPARDVTQPEHQCDTERD